MNEHLRVIKTLPPGAGFKLRWVQPALFARHFELYAEGSRLGELRFETAAIAQGTLRTGGAQMQRWTIKGAGFFRRRVMLRELDAREVLAVFRPSIGGAGWVEFASGSRFRWKATNSWRTQWGFSNVQGGLLFVVKPKLTNPLKKQAAVEVAASLRDPDELPPLLMLGWYLSVQDFYAGW